MPKTFNVHIHLLAVANIRCRPSPRQFDKAREFYGQCDIDVQFEERSMLRLQIESRDFFALQDWTDLGAMFSNSQKGCDLLIVPKMEKIEGFPPFGLTILPGKEPPEGIPKSIVGIAPKPDPTRPAIILNAQFDGQVPIMTLTHELGHALLNSNEHHPKSGNFMFADLTREGDKIEKEQIAQLYASRWLA